MFFLLFYGRSMVSYLHELIVILAIGCPIVVVILDFCVLLRIEDVVEDGHC